MFEHLKSLLDHCSSPWRRLNSTWTVKTLWFILAPIWIQPKWGNKLWYSNPGTTREQWKINEYMLHGKYGWILEYESEQRKVRQVVNIVWICKYIYMSKVVCDVNHQVSLREDWKLLAKKGRKGSYRVLVIFYFLISVMQQIIQGDLGGHVTSVDSYMCLTNSYMRASLQKNSGAPRGECLLVVRFCFSFFRKYISKDPWDIFSNFKRCSDKWHYWECSPLKTNNK